VILHWSHSRGAALSVVLRGDIVSSWGSRNSSHFVSGDRLSADDTSISVNLISGGVVIHFTINRKINKFLNELCHDVGFFCSQRRKGLIDLHHAKSGVGGAPHRLHSYHNIYHDVDIQTLSCCVHV